MSSTTLASFTTLPASSANASALDIILDCSRRKSASPMSWGSPPLRRWRGHGKRPTGFFETAQRAVGVFAEVVAVDIFFGAKNGYGRVPELYAEGGGRVSGMDIFRRYAVRFGKGFLQGLDGVVVRDRVDIGGLHHQYTRI